MMHVRLAAILFAIALIALMPMRLAAEWAGLDDLGITARTARGSVWSGTLAETRYGGIALGDLDAGIDPLPLFAGRLRIGFEQGESMRGAISLARGSISTDDVTARLPLGSTFAPLPLAALELDDVNARFRDGACAAAEGRVRAVVDRGALGLDLPGGLSGNARCDGDALLLPLASRSAMEAVSLRLSADHRWRAELMVRPGDASARDRLLAAGFTRRGAGYGLSVQGALAN